MDFALTDEQRGIAESAQRYLARTYPPQRLAEIADGTGTDPDGWAEPLRQGWFDPELGGVERGLLAEEAGYGLLPVAWTAALATAGLLDTGHPRRPPALVTTPMEPGRAGRISGTAEPVTDAGAAAVLLVTAGAGWYAVDTADPGVRLTELSGVDGLRRGWRVRLTDVAARPVPAPPDGTAAVRLRLRTLAACEAVGVARRALDIAVAHAGLRRQFGRPIGAYQAVAHQLADAYAAIEPARSLAYRAAWCAGSGSADADRAVTVATVAGRRAALTAGETALQVLGGIAMTWEHPIHRWYRRALWLDSAGRSTREQLGMLAAELLATSS